MIPYCTINMPKFQPIWVVILNRYASTKFGLSFIFGIKKYSGNSDFQPASTGVEPCKNRNVFTSIDLLNFIYAEKITQTNAETL